MAVEQTATVKRPRRRLTKDVNGLFFVFGVLAVMMATLPCPMSASNAAATVADGMVSGMTR
jgi:hypothetical protein